MSSPLAIARYIIEESLKREGLDLAEFRSSDITLAAEEILRLCPEAALLSCKDVKEWLSSTSH